MRTLNKTVIVSILAIASGVSVKAQEGFGTNNPAPSSVVDMVSSTKGVLLPRVALTSTTVASPVSAPAEALTVFNTRTTGDVTPGYYYWSVNKWVRLLDNVDNLSWSLKGNTGTNASTNFLGTTDAQDLVLRTNNLERLRVTQTGRLDLSNTTGSATNIFVEGGNETTTGIWNTAVGRTALSSVTSGNQNAAFGAQTLSSLTTGGDNTAFGERSLQAVTIGSNNTSVGGMSGLSATGSNNSIFGFQAGGSLTTGNSNTFIGDSSGSGTTTGSNNIALGNNTAFTSVTASNQLNIGNTIFGTGLTGSAATPAGNIGIGTVAPSNTLEIKSTTANTSGLRFTNLTSASAAASSNGKSLSVDANGDVVLTNKFLYEYYAETPNSPSPSGTLATGAASVAIGPSASATGSTSLALGNNSKATAQSATAVGNSNNATGNNSTAIGFNNTAGLQSNAIGWQNNVSANASNAFGYQNTIAVGQQNHAYGVLNTFSGSSEFSVAFGRLNTINASTAGRFNYVYGFNNTANASAYIFGINNISSADNANILGGMSTAGTAIPAITNSVANSLMIGLSDTAKTTILANGNHGINTTSPTERFDVGSGNVRVRDINTITGLATDKVVVADGTGILKTVDASVIAPAPIITTVANTVTGHKIADYTNEAAAVTDINETVTALSYDSGNRQLNFRDENGATTNFNMVDLIGPAQSLTSLSINSANNTLDYFDENGVTSNLNLSTLIKEPWFSSATNTGATLNTENIYTNGWVGIGYTTPSAAPNEKLRVNGAITTINSYYADYVFEDYFKGSSLLKADYKFMTLPEVDGFIKKNQHLPGITPITALTKSDNGYAINISELSVQLLEKTEELYLHVIEQNKQIEAKDFEIQALKRASEEAKQVAKTLEERLEKLEKLMDKQ